MISNRIGRAFVFKRLFSTVNNSSSSANASVGQELKRSIPDDGVTLNDFMSQTASSQAGHIPPVFPSGLPTDVNDLDSRNGAQRTYFIQTYGCQMNVNDTEIVHSILQKAGFKLAETLEDSDCILINTCSVRENAEKKVWQRLNYFKKLKMDSRDGLRQYTKSIAIMGCMAERLKEKILDADKLVDVVVGPDAYRDLPRLLSVADEGDTAVNTILSLDETYDDISPVRTSSNGISSFVSIMRGCDNMCSYCIVPFTRGRERSRDVSSILREVQELSDQGFKEITLLGQNVNSYNYIAPEDRNQPLPATREARSGEGFTNISRRPKDGVSFTDLLRQVCKINPEIRIRFTSPHPKDFPMELIDLIKETPNLCKYMHMPFQSGSTRVLESMRRGYSKEAYLTLMKNIVERVPEMCFSADIIAGFCGEVHEDHIDTLQVMNDIKFDACYMFKYSQREKTHAHRRMNDDVSDTIKQERLAEIIDNFYENLKQRNLLFLDTVQLVLVERESTREKEHMVGRTDGNKRLIFPQKSLPIHGTNETRTIQIGDYVAVKVTEVDTSMRGEAIELTTQVAFQTEGQYNN